MNENYIKAAHLILKAGRMIRIYYNNGLESHSLNWGHQFILEFIHDNPGITPQELTERFGGDKGTTTKVLKKLREDGLVVEMVDEKDRRVHHLHACGASEQIVKEIKELHSYLRQTLTKGLSQEQLMQMEKGLEVMISNLEGVWDDE